MRKIREIAITPKSFDAPRHEVMAI